MKYLWNYFLDSGNKNIGIRQAEVFSPYSEIIGENFVQRDGEELVLEYNGMYRFEEIFASLYQNSKPGERQSVDLCFDVISHFLMEMDMLKGMTQKGYELRCLMEAIKRGSYGEEVGKLFGQLDVKRQYKICHYLQMIKESGASVQVYAWCLTDVLGKGAVYANTVQPNTLFVYMGCIRNKQDEQLLELIENLFLPISVRVRIFWEHHFGIMGKNESLQYGNIQIL